MKSTRQCRGRRRPGRWLQARSCIARNWNASTSTSPPRKKRSEKSLPDHDLKLEQLHIALCRSRPNFGKRVLEMPILDAFGSPLKIDQIWLPQLTLNNNFRDVARFDRCNTCHQAMDKTQPGSATAARLPARASRHVEVATPTEAEAEAAWRNLRSGQPRRRGTGDDRRSTSERKAPRDVWVSCSPHKAC